MTQESDAVTDLDAAKRMLEEVVRFVPTEYMAAAVRALEASET